MCILSMYLCILSWSNDGDSKFTISIDLFGAIKLSKNLDPHKSSYSGYDIGFDVRGTFPL